MESLDEDYYGNNGADKALKMLYINPDECWDDSEYKTALGILEEKDVRRLMKEL